MGCYRTSNPIDEYKVNKEKGATLIFAIAAAIIVLIVLGGIYYMLTRGFQTSQDIKTYTSVREAAESAVKYGVALINQNKIDGADMPGKCVNEPYIIKYKLFGSNETYNAKIYICMIGESLTGGTGGSSPTGPVVSRPLPQPGAVGKGEIYSIVAESEGPAGTKVRIEASYVR